MEACEALVLTDLSRSIPYPSEILVTQVGPGRRDLFDRIKATCFGMPLALAQQIDARLFGEIDALFHLAYLHGDAVGCAQTFYQRDVAILAGAGVIPLARGNGVFHALIAQRLLQAARDGMRAATIQAYDPTSAPMLRRLGFRPRGELIRPWSACGT